MTILVLGVGSPFAADHLAFYVIECLKQKQSLMTFVPEKLRLEYSDRPGMRLLQWMADVDCIFLVDALIGNNEVGKIHQWQHDPFKELLYHSSNLSTHDIGITQACEMGKALGSLPKELILFTIEIDEATSVASLTSPIEQLAARMEAEILARIG